MSNGVLSLNQATKKVSKPHFHTLQLSAFPIRTFDPPYAIFHLKGYFFNSKI